MYSSPRKRHVTRLKKSNFRNGPLKVLFTNYCLIYVAISKLTALSLKEDPIGVVQNCNTIPTLLNSLLACLIAVEEYIQRPLPSKEFTAYTKLKLDGYQLVRARPYAIASGKCKMNKVKESNFYKTGLSNSIFMIVTAFYENLSFFQFPPKHAYKLQLFVDFKQ